MFENDMTLTDWAKQYTEHPAVLGILQFMCAAMFCISAKKTSAAEFIHCFKKEMLAPEGFHYPAKGGAQAIPNAMSDAIRKFGGQIHTESRVSEIVVKGGKVQGVLVGDKQYNAPIVISNLAIQMTTLRAGRERCEQLVHPETIPGSWEHDRGVPASCLQQPCRYGPVFGWKG